MDDKTNLKFAWKKNVDDNPTSLERKSMAAIPKIVILIKAQSYFSTQLKKTLLEFLKMEFWSISVMKVYLQLIQLL